MLADEDLQRHSAENFDQADALFFGRVTYEMMEAAWRPPARTGARPDEYEFVVQPRLAGQGPHCSRGYRSVLSKLARRFCHRKP
jgi:hypothetical protein